MARGLRSSRVLVAEQDGRIVAALRMEVEAIRLDAFEGPSGGGPFYKKCGFTEVGHAVYRGVPPVYFEFVQQ